MSTIDITAYRRGKEQGQQAEHAQGNAEQEPDYIPSYGQFGECPECGRNDGYANAGKSHTFFCREHKTRWLVGSNLFSSWQDHTEEEQFAIWNEIGLEGFREVKPATEPAAIRELRSKRRQRTFDRSSKPDSFGSALKLAQQTMEDGKLTTTWVAREGADDERPVDEHARRKISEKVQKAIEAVHEAKRAMEHVAFAEDAYNARAAADDIVGELMAVAKRFRTWDDVPGVARLIDEHGSFDPLPF